MLPVSFIPPPDGLHINPLPRQHTNPFSLAAAAEKAKKATDEVASRNNIAGKAEELKGKAEELKGKASGKASEVEGQVKGTAHEVKGKAKGTAEEVKRSL
jgi:uncharacterized protein YjbJ (UPF0337 family)